MSLDDARRAADVYMVVSSLSGTAGGLTKVVLERVRAFAQEKVPSTLLVLGYRHYEGPEAWLMLLRRALPWTTRRRYFWREAPRLLAGVTAHHRRAHRPTVPAGATPRVRRDRLGRRRVVEWTDQEDRLVALEYRAVTGELVMVDRRDPGTGKTTHREHYSAGRHWLTVHAASWRSAATAVLHTEAGSSEHQLAELYARWIDAVVGKDRRAVVFCDGESASLIPTYVRNPRARAVSVLHNPHTDPQWDRRAPTMATWDPALRRTGAVTRVVVLTGAHQADVVARYGEPAPTVVANAIHATRAPRTERDPHRVVTVGRLVRRKRFDHVLKAFATVHAAVPTAHLDVVGDGSSRRHLERLAAKLGLSEHVTFHGFVPDPRTVMARAAIGVLASTHEGMGLVILEGMSVGTPFIAYDVPYGPADIITDGADGVLVPTGSIDGLVGALRQVLLEPGWAQAMRRRALEVVERYSPEQFRHGWLTVFEQEALAPDVTSQRSF